MAKVPFSINREQCEYRGWWWRKGACYTTENPIHDDEPYYDIPTAGVDITYDIPWYRDDELKAKLMTNAGKNLNDHWINLAYEKPPDDLLGKIGWYAGIGAQLIISMATFPVGLAGFILEETLQSWGFSAYMLQQARQYEALQSHVINWKDAIDMARWVRDDIGAVSPIIFGSVTEFILAAAVSAEVMSRVADAQLAKQAETDEKAREKELERMLYAELRLSSSPSQAEIWFDGVNTELLTPETFKTIEPGPHVFEVRKWNKKTEEWDILAFETNMEAGRRKEVLARIPVGIKGETEEGQDTETEEESILPMWIKAEVTGEYAIDGDTFITSTGERIRVLGIDAPEIGRPWADVAKDYLHNQIEDKKIELRILSANPLDVYGRTLAICKNYKGTIAIFLLSAGLARVDIWDDSPLDRYRYDAAEDQAKARKVGIWGELP